AMALRHPEDQHNEQCRPTDTPCFATHVPDKTKLRTDWLQGKAPCPSAPGLRQSRVISIGRREIEWMVDISLYTCYPRHCERAPAGIGAASHRAVRRSRRHLR